MARHAFVDLSAPLWGQVSGTDVHHLEQLRRLPIVGALWYFICARRSNFETVLSRRKRQPRPPFDPIDTRLEVFRQPVVFKIMARNKDAVVGGANCEPQVNPANLSTTNECEPEGNLIPRLAGVWHIQAIPNQFPGHEADLAFRYRVDAAALEFLPSTIGVDEGVVVVHGLARSTGHAQLPLLKHEA